MAIKKKKKRVTSGCPWQRTRRDSSCKAPHDKPTSGRKMSPSCMHCGRDGTYIGCALCATTNIPAESRKRSNARLFAWCIFPSSLGDHIWSSGTKCSACLLSALLLAASVVSRSCIGACPEHQTRTYGSTRPIMTPCIFVRGLGVFSTHLGRNNDFSR